MQQKHSSQQNEYSACAFFHFTSSGHGLADRPTSFVGHLQFCKVIFAQPSSDTRGGALFTNTKRITDCLGNSVKSKCCTCVPGCYEGFSLTARQWNVNRTLTFHAETSSFYTLVINTSREGNKQFVYVHWLHRIRKIFWNCVQSSRVCERHVHSGISHFRLGLFTRGDRYPRTPKT